MSELTQNLKKNNHDLMVSLWESDTLEELKSIAQEILSWSSPEEIPEEIWQNDYDSAQEFWEIQDLKDAEENIKHHLFDLINS